MKKLPNIFKPDIDHYVDNNNEVYYSFGEDKTKSKKNNNNLMRKSNIRTTKLINIDQYNNKKVIIKTLNNDIYNTEILSRMGNNIIMANGKVISIFDIESIEEK